MQVTLNLGMPPADHFLTHLAARGESWFLAHFDQVSTISERLVSRLLQKKVDPLRAVLFPNWVNTSEIYPLRFISFSTCDLRDSRRLLNHFIFWQYGKKQGLESIILVARQSTKRITNYDSIICGDGAARSELEISSQDLANVQFIPLQPPEKLNLLLNIADIHILPQRADAADLVMPSKLLGMLASGKAVIATANPGTELGNVVSLVGVAVAPEIRQRFARRS